MWKPLRGPLNDWPLTVCDAGTVRTENDLEAADLLYPDLATENYQVYFKPYHKWHYLSDHNPSELLVFKQADSLSETSPGSPPPRSLVGIYVVLICEHVYHIVRSLTHTLWKGKSPEKASKQEHSSSTMTSRFFIATLRE